MLPIMLPLAPKPNRFEAAFLSPPPLASKHGPATTSPPGLGRFVCDRPVRYGAEVSLFLYRHAVDRMALRGITREEIQEALQSPETTYTSEDDETRLVILGKTASGRPLMIVVEKADHEAIVTVAERD